MADSNSVLTPPTAEQRRIAAAQFEHANQVVASKKNYNYGIHLLLSCCKLDPGNLIYRQALRRTQKAKYNNNLRGSWLAWLTTSPAKASIKAARQTGDHLKVLEQGERVLCRNPWDVGTQMDMAEAANTLGLLDLAVWTLEQARQKAAQDPKVNRALALLYEQRGNFTQAAALWELVRRADPYDRDAASKMKDLAASDTLVRGQYQAATLGEEENSNDSTEERRALASPAKSSGPVMPGRGFKPVRNEAEVLREKINADPSNVNGWLQLAGHYRRHEEFEKAHALLQEGLGPTGKAFELVVEMADVETEPFRRNLAVAESKLSATPDDEELKRLRLRLRKEINTRELELYRRKAEYYPTEMGHRLELGIRLLRAGLADEAIRELQAARGDTRHRVQAAYYLGLAFKGRNNWSLAQRNFEEAMQHLGPGDKELRKDLLYQIAQGAAHAGDLARAVEVGQELAYEDFSYRDIGRLLEEWQSRLQQAG